MVWLGIHARHAVLKCRAPSHCALHGAMLTHHVVSVPCLLRTANDIGDAGAASLVRVLRELTGLTQLNLACE